MANIKKAAEWMVEGKVVRRKDWIYEGIWDGLRLHRDELAGRVGLSFEDLIADDWQIAEHDLEKIYAR
jgi:hypothetical protein